MWPFADLAVVVILVLIALLDDDAVVGDPAVARGVLTAAVAFCCVMQVSLLLFALCILFVGVLLVVSVDFVVLYVVVLARDLLLSAVRNFIKDGFLVLGVIVAAFGVGGILFVAVLAKILLICRCGNGCFRGCLFDIIIVVVTPNVSGVCSLSHCYFCCCS